MTRSPMQHIQAWWSRRPPVESRSGTEVTAGMQVTKQALDRQWWLYRHLFLAAKHAALEDRLHPDGTGAASLAAAPPALVAEEGAAQ